MFHLSLFSVVFFCFWKVSPWLLSPLPPCPPQLLPPILHPIPTPTFPAPPHFQPLSTASYGGGPAVGCVSVDRVLVFFLDTVVNLEEAVIPV